MKVSILDLNHPIKNLFTGENSEENIGKIFAQTLAEAKTGNPLKYVNWALELYNGRSLSLDEADFKELKAFAENLPAMHFFKIQLMERFEEAEKHQTSKL